MRSFTATICMTRKSFFISAGSRVNIYSLEDFEDYFYGYMVNHTGYLKYFELYPYDQGLVLQLPEREDPQACTAL